MSNHVIVTLKNIIFSINIGGNIHAKCAKNSSRILNSNFKTHEILYEHNESDSFFFININYKTLSLAKEKLHNSNRLNFYSKHNVPSILIYASLFSMVVNKEYNAPL